MAELENCILQGITTNGKPFLDRPLRGFEAMIDYLKTGGRFVPEDPDKRLLLQIELDYFKIKPYNEDLFRKREQPQKKVEASPMRMQVPEKRPFKRVEGETVKQVGHRAAMHQQLNQPTPVKRQKKAEKK